MPTAYIALGANIPGPAGTPRETLDAALTHLEALGQVTLRSCYYATEPVGYVDQPTFLNAAAALKTEIGPEALLTHLLAIEHILGRDRSLGILNGPRAIDLDLLFYGSTILDSPTLILPHPRMAERAFVLVPLAEIAPELKHPILKQTMSQLRDGLTGGRAAIGIDIQTN